MSDKIYKCPNDGTPLEGMGHLAETVFKPCAMCGKEWYYTPRNSGYYEEARDE